MEWNVAIYMCCLCIRRFLNPLVIIKCHEIGMAVNGLTDQERLCNYASLQSTMKVFSE